MPRCVTILFTDIVDSTADARPRRRPGVARWPGAPSRADARSPERVSRPRGEDDRRRPPRRLRPARARRALRAGDGRDVAFAWSCRCASASTSARSSSPATTPAGWRSTPRRGSCRSAARTTSWSRRRRASSSKGSGIELADAGEHELEGPAGRAEGLQASSADPSRQGQNLPSNCVRRADANRALYASADQPLACSLRKISSRVSARMRS